MRCLVWLVCVAGCSFDPTKSAAPDDSAPSDTTIVDTATVIVDTPEIDAGDGCHGTGLVRICPETPPAAPVTLVPGLINTDTSELCVAFTSPTNTVACVIAGTSIDMPAGVFVAIGSKPLVLVSTTMIAIPAGSTIDVSSRRNPERRGAGGDASACVDGTDATSGGGTGGGGFGGSFGGRGGDGTDGDSGGNGGTAADAAAPTSLRGGCPGGNGAGNGTEGGHGGGAVFLIADVRIEIGGTINASGGSGGQVPGSPLPSQDSGGGGAGSGGMIGLDAPAIVVGAGRLFANGGGGGEGASSSLGDSGNESTGPADAAQGGSGVSNAGNGGAGSAGTTLAGTNGTAAASNNGGGGGGGGAGAIVFFPPQTTGTNVAPPAS